MFRKFRGNISVTLLLSCIILSGCSSEVTVISRKRIDDNTFTIIYRRPEVDDHGYLAIQYSGPNGVTESVGLNHANDIYQATLSEIVKNADESYKIVVTLSNGKQNIVNYDTRSNKFSFVTP